MSSQTIVSLLFSYTAVILWQDRTDVQFNILQCIAKHEIPRAGEFLSVQITRMSGHFALTLSSFYLPIDNYRALADRARVLTSFNCLRSQKLHSIYNVM